VDSIKEKLPLKIERRLRLT